jgi:hypothetical protein
MILASTIVHRLSSRCSGQLKKGTTDIHSQQAKNSCLTNSVDKYDTRSSSNRDDKEIGLQKKN